MAHGLTCEWDSEVTLATAAEGPAEGPWKGPAWVSFFEANTLIPSYGDPKAVPLKDISASQYYPLGANCQHVTLWVTNCIHTPADACT